jgi:hypothetical protein
VCGCPSASVWVSQCGCAGVPVRVCKPIAWGVSWTVIQERIHDMRDTTRALCERMRNIIDSKKVEEDALSSKGDAMF